MSLWSPTHVQFTVLRARNLIAKGKGGNNDVFATIQLGREKYQTSTIKNALNPEWFEECDLTIPHMHAMVEVTLFHRGLLSDDFLGYAAVPIWEQKVSETPRSSWVRLASKPTKSGDSKYRGELEVKLTFHCQSKADFGPSGLKKRTPSFRNLASVFGDKFKFTRSRSFRENRRDPEGGKVDRQLSQPGAMVEAEPEDGLTRSYSMSAAYIRSMSLERGPRVFNSMNTTSPTTATTTNNNNRVGGDASTTTAANSTAGATTNTYSVSSSNLNAPAADHLAMRKTDNGSLDWTDSTSASHLYSQSVYNLPGERRSCAELPAHHPPTLPLPMAASRARSQDDSALSAMSRDQTASQPQAVRGNRGRTMSDIQIGSQSHSHRDRDTSAGSRDTSHHNGGDAVPAFLHPPPPPPPSSTIPGQAWREHFYAGMGGGGIYESIKERTEPENSLSSSSSSSSDGESVPMPKSSRVKRNQKKQANHVPSSNANSIGRDDLLLQQQQHHQQQIQQLYRQPSRRPNSTNPEQPTTTGAMPWGGHSQSKHPQPPPSRPAPRPNSYPNSGVPFSSSPSLDSSQQASEQMQALSVRDSGILDDRSSSQGNSVEGSGLTTPDCVSITGLLPTSGTPTTTTASRGLAGQSHTADRLVERNILTSSDISALHPASVAPDRMASAKPGGGGGILYHLDRELAFNSSRQTKPGAAITGDYQTEPGLPVGLPGLWHRRENSQGELVIRKRSRGERDRLRQARQAQGNRRYTVQNMESCPPGAYSDSQSEAGTSPRQEVPEGLLAAYSSMNKEELLRVVIQAKAQMIRKDQYIRDLETYIDDLLVRVMETTPRLLSRPNMLTKLRL